MDSKTYRSTRVKDVDWDRIARGNEGVGITLGIDVGKHDLWPVCRWDTGRFERSWRVKNPEEFPTLMALIQRMSTDRKLVVAMESSGTYGDPLRQALADAKIAVSRVSNKASHDYAEIFDGVPSQHDGKDAAVIAELAGLGKAQPWGYEAPSEWDQELNYWVGVKRVKKTRSEKDTHCRGTYWPGVGLRLNLPRGGKKNPHGLLDDAFVCLYTEQIFKGDALMAIARSQQIDVSVTRWYHCMTRCVRRAFLLDEGEGKTNRKEWLEIRIEELAEIFAVGVGGFSVMDNHLHLLLRLDPAIAQGWSDEEVVRRWGRLFPPRDKSRKPLPISGDWVRGRLEDVAWVARARERLQSISWFMKCLKEPLSRLANREDEVRGAFFEERFKSVAVLDEESLLAVSAYIDLNPVAAKIVSVPEAGEYTSIKTRVEHVEAHGQTDRLEAAVGGSVAGSLAAGGLEESLWLAPIEDRRRFDSSREGMFDGLSLGSYLRLVDYTGRLFRDGKAAISAEVAGIFERLGSGAESWQLRMEKLRKSRLFGRFFAASRERLQAVAGRLGMRWVANLGGCPAR